MNQIKSTYFCFVYAGRVFWFLTTAQLLTFASLCRWCSGWDTYLVCQRSRDWSPAPSKSEFFTHFPKKMGLWHQTILHMNFMALHAYHWWTSTNHGTIMIMHEISNTNRSTWVIIAILCHDQGQYLLIHATRYLHKIIEIIQYPR